MIYGYIRVSSDKQTVENQRFEINNFCERYKLVIDGWIEETISGTKAYNKRELGKLLKRVQKDDLIICAELSRLGRNLFMIMEILNICMTKECRVWTIKDNYRLGDDIQSKVLAFAFGLSAEIERNLISQRTKEALARKKAARAHQIVIAHPEPSRITSIIQVRESHAMGELMAKSSDTIKFAITIQLCAAGISIHSDAIKGKRLAIIGC